MIVTRGFVTDRIITRGYGRNIFERIYREVVRLVSTITKQFKLVSMTRP